MYEPSRHLASFYIAGFQYWDGAFALPDLKAGTTLTFKAERDNPHDSNAMALFFGDAKLGYVPKGLNEVYSIMCFYGHASAFECRILQVAPENDPWEQVRVGIYVCDARVNAA